MPSNTSGVSGEKRRRKRASHDCFEHTLTGLRIWTHYHVKVAAFTISRGPFSEPYMARTDEGGIAIKQSSINYDSVAETKLFLLMVLNDKRKKSDRRFIILLLCSRSPVLNSAIGVKERKTRGWPRATRPDLTHIILYYIHAFNRFLFQSLVCHHKTSHSMSRV